MILSLGGINPNSQQGVQRQSQSQQSQKGIDKNRDKKTVSSVVGLIAWVRPLSWHITVEKLRRLDEPTHVG